MQIRNLLKRIAEYLHYSIGRLTAKIPYRYRLGKEYINTFIFLNLYERSSLEFKNEYTINRLNEIVQFAQNNIPFYRKLYGASKIRIESLKDFEVKVTRLAHGIPVGSELDYLDEGTISIAFKTRAEF